MIAIPRSNGLRAEVTPEARQWRVLARFRGGWYDVQTVATATIWTSYGYRCVAYFDSLEEATQWAATARPVDPYSPTDPDQEHPCILIRVNGEWCLIEQWEPDDFSLLDPEEMQPLDWDETITWYDQWSEVARRIGMA